MKLKKVSRGYKDKNLCFFNNGVLSFLLDNCVICENYYRPSKILDYDKELNEYPRVKEEDERFIKNALFILGHTKNEKKLEVINKLLNRCVVFDTMPVLGNSGSSYKDGIIGKFHIIHVGDECEDGTLNKNGLKDFERDAVNYSASHIGLKNFCYVNGEQQDKMLNEMELFADKE